MTPCFVNLNGYIKMAENEEAMRQWLVKHYALDDSQVTISGQAAIITRKCGLTYTIALFGPEGMAEKARSPEAAPVQIMSVG